MDKKKKDEEERMKKIKSGKKNDPFLLSSIKKYTEDNSNIASTSMLNEVNQFFPGVIPEEKAENEEDEDYSKKNFKKNSKIKYPKKESSSKKDKKENDKKSKSKSKSKKVSDFGEKLNKEKNQNKIIKSEKEEEKEEQKEEEKKEGKNPKKQKNKKKISQSKKSNGLGIAEKPKISIKNESNKRQFDDNNENEEFSDYGDKLQSSDSDVPKKRKIKVKDPKFPKLPKKLVRDRYYSENQELIRMYHAQENMKLFTYDIETDKQPKGFGINGRYSLRNRIPPLRKEFGEHAHYVYGKNGPELIYVEKVSNPFAGFTYINNKAKNQIEENINRKRKKLVKGGVILEENSSDNSSDNNSEEKDKNNDENKDDYNSDLLNSQDFSEFGEDEARFLKIPKGGKKNAAKNYDTLLTIKVHEAQGKNMIKVDKITYKDLKSGDTVRVNKNQIYEILNFSDYELIVQLLLDEEDN